MRLIGEPEALGLLRGAVERAGGVRAYARLLGCQPSFISNMINGHSYITGVVADDLRISSVHAYRYTGERKSPEQERYENNRIQWRIDHPPITAQEIQERLDRQASEAGTEPSDICSDQSPEK